jgi:hypothetical protein
MQSQNAQYTDLYRDQSTWPLRYITTQTQPTDPLKPVLGLNVPEGVAPGLIEVYNKIGVPPPTRTKRLKSEQEINTELYGTAPYLGSGDGVMFHVEKSTMLRDSIPTLRGARSRHLMADPSYNRWDFLTVPTAAQSVSSQIGAESRAEPAYE